MAPRDHLDSNIDLSAVRKTLDYASSWLAVSTQKMSLERVTVATVSGAAQRFCYICTLYPPVSGQACQPRDIHDPFAQTSLTLRIPRPGFLYGGIYLNRHTLIYWRGIQSSGPEALNGCQRICSAPIYIYTPMGLCFSGSFSLLRASPVGSNQLYMQREKTDTFQTIAGEIRAVAVCFLLFLDSCE